MTPPEPVKPELLAREQTLSRLGFIADKGSGEYIIALNPTEAALFYDLLRRSPVARPGEGVSSEMVKAALVSAQHSGFLVPRMVGTHSIADAIADVIAAMIREALKAAPASPTVREGEHNPHAHMGGMERFRDWLDHWLDPHACDDLVLTGVQAYEVAEWLKLTPQPPAPVRDEALEQAAKVADDRRQFQESGVEATETSDGRADEARIIAASIRALQERGKAP